MNLEERRPLSKPFDVLVQYLVTIAVSDGFKAEEIYREVKGAYTYRDMTEDEWLWAIDYITTGGETLKQYDEYNKAVLVDGLYKVTNRKIAMQHRLSIGTIVSEVLMKIQFVSGNILGTIEEYFISRLNPGDVFWFACRSLELVRVKENTAYVRKSASGKGIIPSWEGARNGPFHTTEQYAPPETG